MLTATPALQRGLGDDDDLIDFQRVQDVMATLMAKGFVLGKDALAKAKARDVAPRRCATQPRWLRPPAAPGGVRTTAGARQRRNCI